MIIISIKKIFDQKRIKSKKLQKKVGLPPGSIIHSGDIIKKKTVLKIIDYNENNYHIHQGDSEIKDLGKLDKNMKRWIDIEGLFDIERIEEVGEQFSLHPLVLEDLLNKDQRAKYENYEEYTFIVLKQLSWDENKEDFVSDQISIILGKNYLISFKERESNLFDPIIERITIPKGRVRYSGIDYLAYVLLDIIIDHYFVTEELIGDYIEEIETELVENPTIETLQAIYKLKRTTINLRKSIWPVRDIINNFLRDENLYQTDNLQIYLRDLYDHIYRINETIQNYREIISGMLDIYLSSVSNKMNDIMKVLTIISTIFIPLSFLAGFYGMNFLYMPELASPVAYPLLIIIMISISILMLYFFKKKNWL